MLSERLGRWHFWLFVIGFHLTFDTLHFPGLLGMPRRIYTYEASRGWGTLNLIATIGVAFQGAGDPGLPLERRRARSRRGSSPATIRGTRGRSSGSSRRRRRPTTSRSSRSCGAAARSGTSSIRTIRTGSTNERPRRRPAGAARALGAAGPRQGRDGLPDRRRGGDLHDLRRRVRLLPRQERARGRSRRTSWTCRSSSRSACSRRARRSRSRSTPCERAASARSARGGRRRSCSPSSSWRARASSGSG